MDFLKKLPPIFFILWAIFKEIFTWLSGADFVITRSKDPDWLGDVIAFLFNPTPAFNLAVFAIGVSWLAYLVWRSREAPLEPAVAVLGPEGETAKERMLRGRLRFGLPHDDSHTKLARAIERTESNRSSLKFGEMIKEGVRQGAARELKKKRMQLWTLREEGVGLYHQRILAPAQYEPWHQQFENWHSRILEAANDLDPELRAILSPLRECPKCNHGWPFNSEHRLALDMIWETCARVEKYLDRTQQS